MIFGSKSNPIYAKMAYALTDGVKLHQKYYGKKSPQVVVNNLNVELT